MIQSSDRHNPVQILRPSDLVLAYNKIVVQCKESQAGGEASTVALSDVVSQLESVSINYQCSHDEINWTNVDLFN